MAVHHGVRGPRALRPFPSGSVSQLPLVVVGGDAWYIDTGDNAYPSGANVHY
ncbi:hypothetical protein SCB29_13705 [Paraburkholderia sp. SIMBA_055]